ncbi:M14 family zinc carboxypeptidase [Acidobacteriota bacterium]
MRLRNIFVLLCVTGLSGTIYLFGSSVLKTPAEETNYTQYSQHEGIVRFLSMVDYKSDVAQVRTVGRSLPARQYGAKDIFLCILTEEGISRPAELNRTKPTLLLVAAKHGNEQSAKEAALWMIRDLSLGELRPLLKRVNVLILPQSNPYGNFFDTRRNEQDIDLNRDQVKLESPESEVINRIFRTWMPEVTMDVHEKGDDFYRVSTGCVSNANIHSDIQKFSRSKILSEVSRDLEGEGITFQEYLITQRLGIDSSAGVTYRAEDQGSGQMMKRYSTTDLNDGRNSPGIYETFSFIQEIASRHDVETLRERTVWQYFGIRYFLESVVRHGEEINRLVANKRSELLERARITTENDTVHLRMKYARDPGQPVLNIRKFVRPNSPVRGVLKVDKKAGDLLTAADLQPHPFPPETAVGEEVVKNWFPLVEPTLSVSRPSGYILPAKFRDVLEILLKHGIEVRCFDKDTSIDVEVYTVKDVVPADYDYLPPPILDVEKSTRSVLIKRGDFYVACCQPAANLIPCLLEPQAQYGLIRYWKLKLVPGKGDVYPFFRYVGSESLSAVPYANWK